VTFYVGVGLVLIALAIARVVRQRRKEAGPHGWLYFIGSGGGGPIKVGVTTTNPQARLSALQTGSHHKLNLVWAVWVADRYEAEGYAHNFLSEAHVRGEWYRRRDVLELIDILKGDD
jgi:urease beta subunit